MDVAVDLTVEVPECPDAAEHIERRMRETMDELLRFVRDDAHTLRLLDFEQALWPWIAMLFRLAVALFLARRHARLDLGGWLAEGWRVKKEFAARTIKTMCGPVKYARAYLTRRNGSGWFPLDAALGITRDGRLHGPIHKKIWGRFGRRKDALQWARDQATRRGFGPDTDKPVQIVLDGERCLRKELLLLFPRATFTLDLRHAQERLWKAGRLFHAEASPELEQWVEPLNGLLLGGQVDELLDRLRDLLSQVPLRGPNTKRKREVLQTQIAYFEERRAMMHYDEYRRQDLVLATGVIEGACRYVVKERLDCAGMRWTLEGAERLLQLRCIELNGDWEGFITWAADQTSQELAAKKLVKLRHQKSKPRSRTSPKPAASAA